MTHQAPAQDGVGANPLEPDFSLVVAIPTFRRPESMLRTVAAVLEHVAELRASTGADAEVIVVDNDPDRSGAIALAGAGLAARCVMQPAPGIAATRNRALDAAKDARLLVFIDDDESPEPGWLQELVRTWTTYQPSAVWGRVTSVFDVPLDPWLEAGGFFRRKARETGTCVPVAASGNLLLDMQQVRHLGVRFDERVGTSGGEDTLFTRTLTAHGGTIVWCQESNVLDVVPQERANRSWVLRRALSHGNAAVRVELSLAGTARARAWRRAEAVGRGSARLATGVARAGFGVVSRNVGHQARGSRLAARGVGIMAAGLGLAYREYARGSGWRAHWVPLGATVTKRPAATGFVPDDAAASTTPDSGHQGGDL